MDNNLSKLESERKIVADFSRRISSTRIVSPVLLLDCKVFKRQIHQQKEWLIVCSQILLKQHQKLNRKEDSDRWRKNKLDTDRSTTDGKEELS